MIFALLIIGLFAFVELAWPAKTARGELMFPEEGK